MKVRTIFPALAVAALVACWVAGCTFESELSNARCSDAGVERGTVICKGGFWVWSDTGGTTPDGQDGGCVPSPESCDNDKDDDCDRTVNEGCDCNYMNSKGVCGEAEIDEETGECAKPDSWVKNEGTAGYCGDGKDNDCDGDTDGDDDGCTCTHKEKRKCYMGSGDIQNTGYCEGARQGCKPTGKWGPCSKTPNTTDEGKKTSSDPDKWKYCGNSTDDDCDGNIDEGCPCDVKAKKPRETEGKGVCANAQWTEKGGCDVPNTYTMNSSEDQGNKCNDNEDNNCDGVTNDGCSCSNWNPPTSDGVCNNPGSAIVRDDGSCAHPAYEQREKTCDDGLDNDCDGKSDFDGPDLNCLKPAGKPCKDDGECISQKCKKPGGSQNSKCQQTIFVTSMAFRPGKSYSRSGLNTDPVRFKSVSEAHQACNDLAAKAGLSGTWKAVLSDSNKKAKARIQIQPGYELFNRKGDKVAAPSKPIWDGDIESEIKRNEKNGSDVDKPVWTGTTRSGERSTPANGGGNCNDWSSGNSNEEGMTGDSKDKNHKWVEDQTKSCDNEARIYCIDGQ